MAVGGGGSPSLVLIVLLLCQTRDLYITTSVDGAAAETTRYRHRACRRADHVIDIEQDALLNRDDDKEHPTLTERAC